MRASENCFSIIKKFEGLKLIAYFCPANVLTIGYGHTGKDVVPNQTITLEKASELLKQDTLRFEKAVNKLVQTTINQNQFDALVSFTYNLGEGNLKSSTLLKKVNSNNFAEAAQEFLKWNKAGGKVLPGLVKRREAEKELFEKKL